jgi:NAD(P)-dependent dehydrogenase (short-subunit alcohol dehydrogenase family)
MATILVTGATDGLGRAVTERLVRDGHTVLAHGRDPERLAASPAARTYRADLASLDAVRGLAADLLEHEPRIDVLISNAGIGTTIPGGPRRQVSADGIELRFAVNYLAGYLLTRLLLDRLRESAPARIVHVSSGGQQAIDFADPLLEHGYDGMRAYCQSKLAQILLVRDLAEELAGSGVTATCLHPGTYMPTKIVDVGNVDTLESGRDAVVRLAVDPAVEGISGAYFDHTRQARPHPQADDPQARAQLRELSRRLTGV